MAVVIFGSEAAPHVLIQPADSRGLGFMEDEAEEIRRRTGADFCLLGVEVADWNRDLSPWQAPAVFGTEAFGDGAGRTLEEILGLCGDDRRKYYIGGYSLAGLFALWAACETDLFSGVAAASPSVWFPGFPAYLREHEVLSRHVYLSLGDREERTRNPVMRTVGDEIRAAYALLRDRGTDCTLEWNEGNHFRDADARTAKAFAWVMKRA